MAANGFQHLTVHRELAHNRFRDPGATWDRRRDMSGHHPFNIQDQALARRRRLAKLARHEGLLAHVVGRLAASNLEALAGGTAERDSAAVAGPPHAGWSA